MQRQRRTLGSSGEIGLSAREVERHIGDIAEALVMIHFPHEVTGYRFKTREMLEQRLVDEGVGSPETLDEWYGIVLRGGEDERLASWLHIWRSVGLEGIHSMIRSVERAVVGRVAPIASSQ